MSNARIQFSLASEDVWNAYNPQLNEGEIVTVLKANKKVKLVQGKVGGSTYSESTVIWDEDEAQTIMSRSEDAASTATAQAAAASGSASKAAASQAAAATSATNVKASETAAKTSETNAKASETAAKTSATSAASSASSASTASTQAGKAADSASASKEAAKSAANTAQSAANTASNFATSARSSASEAKSYRDATSIYAANAKNYSENVNVFVPSVDADGTLTWTNKAGLANPAAVNIKGAKGDKGDPGPQGPKGDGAITVDAALSDTSINPVQNKVVKAAIDAVKNNMTQGFQTVTASIPTKVSALENDAGYLTQHQSLDGYAQKSTANTWAEQQAFKCAKLGYEKYASPKVSGTSNIPAPSVMRYIATGAFTLNLNKLLTELDLKESSVFTAYIESSADYPLTITNAGTLKYIGSASDVAITSAGLLLNILMMKDADDMVTSIVQASKLS